MPMNTHRLLAWLPPGQRKPLLQRLLIVWAVSLPIAVATWIGLHWGAKLAPCEIFRKLSK